MRRSEIAPAISLFAFIACADPNRASPDPKDAGPATPFDIHATERGAWIARLETDRARYDRGAHVALSIVLSKTDPTATLRVRAKHLDDVVLEETIAVLDRNELAWEWTPPDVDARGYLLEAIVVRGGATLDHANIAVDVSSSWAKFPRYGFLSNFGVLTTDQRRAFVRDLNRHHIDVVQFYDWQFAHHQPLALDGDAIAPFWKDIANRDTVLATIEGYLELCHARGMAAMNYNLLYGAYANAALDGVLPEWGLFKDPMHREQDFHPLPATWASDIYLQDPGNRGWQNYLFDAERMVFERLAFDGWHVDQLGDRGTRFSYAGGPLSLDLAFTDFLTAAHDALGVPLVMNAVAQYGQAEIAAAPVDFLYTEVWPPFEDFVSLKAIIDANSAMGGKQLSTVLAAYVNYDLAHARGMLNTPGVLMLDAVIFASGGAHLEYGEHLLTSEYFPNDNLTTSAALHAQLVAYYDFLVAYENVLRDGFTELGPLSVPGVWAFAKTKEERDAIHVINTSPSTAWRDTDGTQPAPQMITDLSITVPVRANVSRVWWASPDVEQGSPMELSFQQHDGMIEVVLPSLEYWDLLVVEH